MKEYVTMHAQTEREREIWRGRRRDGERGGAMKGERGGRARKGGKERGWGRGVGDKGRDGVIYSRIQVSNHIQSHTITYNHIQSHTMPTETTALLNGRTVTEGSRNVE